GFFSSRCERSTALYHCISQRVHISQRGWFNHGASPDSRSREHDTASARVECRGPLAIHRAFETISSTSAPVQRVGEWPQTFSAHPAVSRPKGQQFRGVPAIVGWRLLGLVP